MNILFIGDVFGRPGRRTIQKLLPTYREKFSIDLVIANAENMHHGKGVSPDQVAELQKSGVDFFTSGNHVWHERSIIPHMNDRKFPLIRPANYPYGAPGRGWSIIETDSKKVLIINLMGRVFMHEHLDCPFRAADRILKEFEQEKLAAILVDFHAEATSEKVALGHYLDGRVSAVTGTHTHVPTRDERILPLGTAYLSDVGFTGPVDSVIGIDKKVAIQRFLTQMPVKHEVAGGETVFNAVKIHVDDGTKKALTIEHIQEYFSDF